MAGKTRLRGTAVPRGHMELKSSALCTTDAKLVSQYLVVEHMAAHYKKLNEAKSRIDTTIPKVWAVSTKVRDRFRREALCDDIGQHKTWPTSRTARPSSRVSYNVSRGHRSPTNLQYTMRLDDGDFDGIDGATFGYDSPVGRDDATERLRLSEDDMRLVNQIIQDSRTSPSKYHHTPMTSNIPSTGKVTKNVRTLPQHRSQILQTCAVPSNYISSVSRNQGGATHRYVNPRSSDLLEKQSHMFTDEKPFVPRTLKTNCTSKLTEFKYYNPPPPKKHGRPARDVTRDGVDLQRAETPMTESVDLMNETLMSRGAARVPPSGIPPLDISLDADHILWLKEQSRNAQMRKTSRYTSRPASSLSHQLLSAKSQKFNVETKPLPKTRRSLSCNSQTAMLIQQEEDELRHLEFISDVTNDVLDRGIFSNRVLKQVFESHIEKWKGELKESKMRELLADLWNDLGISPDVDVFDASPSAKHRHLSSDVDVTASKKQPDVTSEASEPVPPPRPAHRQHRSGRSSPGSPQMPVLKAAAHDRMHQQSKPPLPTAGSVRSQYSICDDDVFEEEEDEDERNAQKDTQAMMAAILNNGCNDTLRTTGDMFEFDIIDTDDIQRVKEMIKDSVLSDGVVNEEQTFSQGVVVTKEQSAFQTACDSPAKLQPSSPGIKKMDERETSSETFPKEQTASVKDKLPKLDNCAQDRGDTGNGSDDRHDKPTNGDHDVDNVTHEPEITVGREGDILMQERKLLEDTDKDSPVFNNNENEKDTSRSGGTGYTDDGWESQAADDVTEDDDTLRGSGTKEQQGILAKHDETGHDLPRPTPRQSIPAASSRSDVNNTPKSLVQTASSESLDVSDLDEDDEDF